MGDADDLTERSAARGHEDVIEIVLPLRAEYGATLRVVVASLGADVGFTIDEIDDLRLGVSEVFNLLVDDAGPDDRCAARLQVEPGSLAVVFARRGGDARLADTAPELDPLASTILASVVDEYHELADGLRLVKRATESTTSND